MKAYCKLNPNHFMALAIRALCNIENFSYFEWKKTFYMKKIKAVICRY